MNTERPGPDGDDAAEPPPATPAHVQDILKASEDAVHADRYEQHTTFRGRLEWRVLDRLAAFVRQHYWQIRPIRTLAWERMEAMPDPAGDYPDDTCPVFAVTIAYDELRADPRPAPALHLGAGSDQPVILAMPIEPPGGTVQIRTGRWAGATLTRRRDGYWSLPTPQGTALWTWQELLTAAGPDGAQLIPSTGHRPPEVNEIHMP